jgi:hypothetical protein
MIAQAPEKRVTSAPGQVPCSSRLANLLASGCFPNPLSTQARGCGGARFEWMSLSLKAEANSHVPTCVGLSGVLIRIGWLVRYTVLPIQDDN